MLSLTSTMRALSFCMFAALTLVACNTAQSLTQEEMAIQNAADEQVALTLFERDLDNSASYNVHKDGFVVIKFKQSVPERDYTAAVDKLRSNPSISGVRAEQGGREVCILKHGR